MSSESSAITVGLSALKTPRCSKTVHFWRRRRTRRAQTTVEFAVALIPFFLILFTLIDYAQIYWYDNALQNAMREAARFATAGRVIPPLTAPFYETNGGVVMPKALSDGSEEASRNECIRYWFQSNCVLYVPLTNITIISAPALNGEPPTVATNNGALHLELTNGGTANSGPGGANDYIQIIANYQITTITPFFSHGSSTYKFRVSAIVKNEPAYLNFLHTNIYSSEVINPNVQ
jgi:hypothetical protein